MSEPTGGTAATSASVQHPRDLDAHFSTGPLSRRDLALVFVVTGRGVGAAHRSFGTEVVAGQLDALERLTAMGQEVADVLAPYGDDLHRVHYDVADPGVLAGLFGWLGRPFEEAQVREFIAVRHSH